ncbi:MAG: cellulase family glycosylhydrolase [Ktedonobacteraceae bacterium]|nr:cellulase family glycosylhydrolase [Ktedonobacteraceae bacterium]
MLTGVNYWPRRQYVNMWKQFKLPEVREDLELIKEFKMEVVRFFLLWEDFQPTPDKVDTQQLEHLDQLLSLFEELEMKAIVTVFNGLMGYARYLPSWVMSSKLQTTEDYHHPVNFVNGRISPSIPKKFYTELREGQQLLLTAVGQVTRKHSSVWMLDLANEPNFIQVPTEQEASEWIKAMKMCFKAVDPDHPVTLGAPFAEKNGWPFESLRELDIQSIHKSYDFQQDGTLSEASTWMEVEMCRSTHKPFLIEEWGLPTRGEQTKKIHALVGDTWAASEELQARMLEDVLHKAEKRGPLALLVWDGFDFDPVLTPNPTFERAPQEAWFGLFRADGSPKPAALVMREY